MIYDFPAPSSPIGQGDIFFGVPIVDLTDDELSGIDDDGNVQTLSWESFASAGENVSAIVAIRPTIAIVGTQECDALRAPNITLFEVRPFRDVERKSKDTSKPSKWVPLITQHARINQKWFYLPADERIGFGEKMGVDFLTPIRVPRLTLERLIGFRTGRLNEVAKQHFRERLAEFFRRYAYDEWYPLTREELAEYRKNHPDAEPFPWQLERHISEDKEVGDKSNIGEISKYDPEKVPSGYVVEWKEAVAELTAILTWIDTEIESLTDSFNRHSASLQQLKAAPEGSRENELSRVVTLAASDMIDFSKRVEVVLPKFGGSIQLIENVYIAYLSYANPQSDQDAERVLNSRSSLSEMLSGVRVAKKVLSEQREATLSIKTANVNEEFNRAAGRQLQAFDGLLSNVERLESFAIKMMSLVDEKFGEPPASEDKTE